MPRTKKLNTPEKRARVGERIKVAATQAGLTLKELAEQTDTSPSLIYQYVRGITSIPDTLLERVAAVTRVHTDFFDPEKDGRSALALPAEALEGQGTISTTEPATRARMQAEMRRLHEIAQAHDYPKRNHKGYLTALGQMLGLARALEDRRQEGWILWRMGCAHIAESELDAAVQHIQTAREIFRSEDLEEYRYHATHDLVAALGEMGAYEAAQSYLDEMTNSTSREVRWRVLLALGHVRYQQNDHEGALRYFCQAAAQLEGIPAEQRSKEGMPQLMTHIADVVRATGHYQEAMLLWNRCLQQATSDRQADTFLESLMEIAQCALWTGRLSEARQKLELAVVLASFLFEDEARLGIARALLAETLLAMGAVDEAKENARTALRIANRVRGARPTILASLALAEIHLVNGQWQESLEFARDALNEAQKTRRTRETGQAQEIRARAFLKQAEAALASGETAQAQMALGQAFGEASQAQAMAERASAIRERIAAHLTLARCHTLRGDTEAAEREARLARELSGDGAVALIPLIGKESVEKLPELLRTPDFDLPSLFASRKIELPGLEWQAHYLEGALLAKRLGSEAALPSLHGATQAVTTLLSGLTPTEAVSFRERYPEASRLLTQNERLSGSGGIEAEPPVLLEGVR